jgi:spore coat polysaccharide biosynthesis predicted glycosyltransferase SpsG
MCDLLVLPNMHTPCPTLVHLRAAFGDCLRAGAEYVMLDQEVTARAPIPHTERMRRGSIVFCAGGSDPATLLFRLCRWCIQMKVLPDVPKIFCYGAYASYATHDLSYMSFPNMHWKPFVREDLRTGAMVITTMGQTVYETMYWQTPALIVGHTDRHCEAAKTVAQHSTWWMEWCDVRTVKRDAFCHYLAKCWGATDVRTAMAQSTRGALDGQGVERVAQAIMELA